MISVRIQDKPFNIMVIQVYAPTNNGEEAEVEWFYEELQDFLGVLVLKGLIGLHRTIQLQLLKRYWLGHRLGLLCY